jgi:hypothetical protein
MYPKEIYTFMPITDNRPQATLFFPYEKSVYKFIFLYRAVEVIFSKLTIITLQN